MAEPDQLDQWSRKIHMSACDHMNTGTQYDYSDYHKHGHGLNEVNQLTT